jgi:hypothetical protein
MTFEQNELIIDRKSISKPDRENVHRLTFYNPAPYQKINVIEKKEKPEIPTTVDYDPKSKFSNGLGKVSLVFCYSTIPST